MNNDDNSFIDIKLPGSNDEPTRLRLDSLDPGELSALAEVQSQCLSPEHSLRLAKHLHASGAYKDMALVHCISRNVTALLLRRARWELTGLTGTNSVVWVRDSYSPEKGTLHFLPEVVELNESLPRLHNLMSRVQSGEYVMAKPHRTRLALRILTTTVELAKPENHLALVDPKSGECIDAYNKFSPSNQLADLCDAYARGHSHCTSNMTWSDYQRIQNWMGGTYKPHRLAGFEKEEDLEKACRQFEEGDQVVIFQEGFRRYSRTLTRASSLSDLKQALDYTDPEKQTEGILCGATLPRNKERLLHTWIQEKEKQKQSPPFTITADSFRSRKRRKDRDPEKLK